MVAASPDSVFLDSGIFIAFLNSQDRWHLYARRLFALNQPEFWTSLLVVSETYSWFLHRMGEEAARTFRGFLRNLDGLRLLETTSSDHEATEGLLDRLRGSKLTYVDAASLWLVNKHRINTVWATDRHLGLTGVKVLPV